MALRDTFVAVPLRERSGPRSSDRFGYQKDWALCRLLDLHAQETDYLLVFDYHDDVLEFDSEEDPRWIKFFQVKTTEAGHWTLGGLLKQKNGKDRKLPSMLGRLYSNLLAFPAETSALTIVSNSRYKLNLIEHGEASTGRLSITYAQLTVAIQRKIEEQIRTEHGMSKEEAVSSDLITFKVSELSLGDHATHAKGHLQEFLERLQPDGKFRLTLIYRSISDEIQRRNNYQGDIKTFAHVVEKKGLGRSEFMRMLQHVGVFEDYEAHWRRAEEQLAREGVPYSRLQSLGRCWKAVEARRADVGQRALSHLRDAVRRHHARVSCAETLQLKELMEEVLSRVKSEASFGSEFDDDDVRALILMRCYEAGKLPPIDSASSQEREKG